MGDRGRGRSGSRPIFAILAFKPIDKWLFPEKSRSAEEDLAARCAGAEATWKFPPSESANSGRNVYRDYYDAMNRGKQGDWQGAKKGLQKLAREGWAIPGIRENLGAANLELENTRDAEAQIDSEITLLNSLDRRPDDDLIGLNLVDPLTKPPPTVSDVRDVLKRARALAQYNMASVYAQEGDPVKAFRALELAIASGYGNAAGDLDTLERDRLLAPSRNLPDYEKLLAPLRVRLGR